jgi:hypothetical protein
MCPSDPPAIVPKIKRRESAATRRRGTDNFEADHALLDADCAGSARETEALSFPSGGNGIALVFIWIASS